MFPALLEEVGWARDFNSIPGGSLIALGDSVPLDTFPFLLTFMNHWLKQPGSMVIFVSFKTAQARLTSAFRKLFGSQLPMLSAQGRFAFVDGVYSEAVFDAIKTVVKPNVKTLMMFEGFSMIQSLSKCIELHSLVQDLCAQNPSTLTALFQWSRSLEADYPGRSEVIREDVDCGGRGWLYLLERSHFVFCARPLRSGMTKEVAGEIVATFGPQMQAESSTLFHPICSLYRMPTDTSIQLLPRGSLK